MVRGRVVTGFGGPDMEILVSKLRAQGWSSFLLQGNHQRRFGKDELYEFYTHGVAIGEMISTSVHGKLINFYPANLGRILSVPTGGWGHYMKGSWPPLDNLPSTLVICRKFSGNPLFPSHRRFCEPCSVTCYYETYRQPYAEVVKCLRGKALEATQAIHEDEKRDLEAQISSLTTTLEKERTKNAAIIRSLTSFIPSTSSK
ncbi:hypothetical protein P3S68_004777 [Capsicum galapagoense]